MANPSGAKGAAWETAVVRWLREHGWPNAERRVKHGILDEGDVSGIRGVVIEAKDVRRLDLRAWCDEAERERKNAGASVGVVVLKRSGTTDVGDSYSIMRTREMAAFLFERECLIDELERLRKGGTR